MSSARADVSPAPRPFCKDDFCLPFTYCRYDPGDTSWFISALPLIMKSNHVSYTAIGFFSMCAYPYSLKLFWSPIVDSLFFKSVGRRKSWILPVQLVMGALMMLLGHTVEGWLHEAPLPIVPLTAFFFVVTFLAATQDIAVDGWGLEMFDEPDRYLCSQCQTVGTEAGYFISYTVFMALNSADFCNSYLRSAENASPLPIVTVGDYLLAVGSIYVIVTAFLFFREEQSVSSASASADAHQHPELTPWATYKLMWQIIQLPSIRVLISLLLLSPIGVYIIRGGLFELRLTAGGISRTLLASSAVINFPIQLFAAFFISHWIQSKPLDLWLLAYKMQLALSFLAVLLVFFVPTPPTTAAVIGIFIILAAAGVSGTIRLTAMGAFFAAVSDPKIGGTYLTLLNTVANFGAMWPKYFILTLIDLFSDSTCVGATGSCAGDASSVCVANGGTCRVAFDGYYPVAGILILAGVGMLPLIRKHLLPLQYEAAEKWDVLKGATV